jgi:hypothetical protein
LGPQRVKMRVRGSSWRKPDTSTLGPRTQASSTIIEAQRIVAGAAKAADDQRQVGLCENRGVSPRTRRLSGEPIDERNRSGDLLLAATANRKLALQFVIFRGITRSLPRDTIRFLTELGRLRRARPDRSRRPA